MWNVLVIGAGPTGLMMASELIRQGLTCRLIDKSSGPTIYSKALAIQARTLEIFGHIGIADEMISHGVRVGAMSPMSRGKRLARIDFSSLESSFPFVLSLEQSQTEKILIQHLAKLGVKVERETELVNIRETKAGVEAEIRDPTGKTEHFVFAWAVGCDGAHSTVRKQLGFTFDGKALADIFSLADLFIDNWPIPHGEGSLFLEKDGLLAALPLAGKGRYRLIFQLERCRDRLAETGMIHGAFQSETIPAPTLDEVQSLVSRYTSPEVRVRDPNWMVNFHVHSRLIHNFGKGRIFLAGDAAHIHSPAGGQGMNTGIQDAFNLAWKLALVHRGNAPFDLLDTYNLERRNVAKTLLKATEFATYFATLRKPLAISLRNWIMERLASLASFRKHLISALSQTAIQYPKSAIVIDALSSGPKAGTRVPNVKFFGRDGPIDLDTLLRNTTCLHLLFFTGPRPTEERMKEMAGLAESMALPTEPILIAHAPETPIFPGIRAVSDPDGTAHARFSVEKEAAYLIRPDLVIGIRCNPNDLMKYLS